jgi:hypothetical protein
VNSKLHILGGLSSNYIFNEISVLNLGMEETFGRLLMVIVATYHVKISGGLATSSVFQH